MCRLGKWPAQTLDEKIDSQLYKRTAISRRPEKIIKAELDTMKSTMVYGSAWFGRIRLFLLSYAMCEQCYVSNGKDLVLSLRPFPLLPEDCLATIGRQRFRPMAKPQVCQKSPCLAQSGIGNNHSSMNWESTIEIGILNARLSGNMDLN